MEQTPVQGHPHQRLRAASRRSVREGRAPVGVEMGLVNATLMLKTILST
jgi:hypothetical protein